MISCLFSNLNRKIAALSVLFVLIFAVSTLYFGHYFLTQNVSAAATNPGSNYTLCTSTVTQPSCYQSTYANNVRVNWTFNSLQCPGTTLTCVLLRKLAAGLEFLGKLIM
jgi:hypothetical protein